jgi:hypothetical protein
MPVIFISYIDEEKEVAHFLADTLQAHFRGVTVSAYSWRQRPGEDWQQQLRHNLSSADAVVFLLGPKSIHKQWILFEYGAAWFSDKLLIPVYHSGLRPEDLQAPLNTIVHERAENPSLGSTLCNTILAFLKSRHGSQETNGSIVDGDFHKLMVEALAKVRRNARELDLFVSFPLNTEAWENLAVSDAGLLTRGAMRLSGDRKHLREMRGVLIGVVNDFVTEYRAAGYEVFFAGAKSNTDDNKTYDVAVSRDLLRTAREFVLIWPARFSSGALCEAAMAYTLGIRSRYYRRESIPLPTFLSNLENGGQSFQKPADLARQLRAAYLPGTTSEQTETVVPA